MRATYAEDLIAEQETAGEYEFLDPSVERALRRDVEVAQGNLDRFLARTKKGAQSA